MASFRELLKKTKAEIREIDPGDAETRLSDATFLDIRELEEFEQGMIPGAVFIPRGHLESQAENKLPRHDAPIVIYCAGGNRSAFAAKTLEDLGYTDVVSMKGGFNRWTVNDVAFAEDHMQPMFRVKQGKRYRLRMHNASDDIHPIHLHRHSFELTRVAGQPVSGVIKDVVMVGGYQETEVSFVADNPGLTLFHCHQQLHMDYGFMTLFDYV
jgi:FtsP/CotA-like multicopper oxidase with cupredoxin domain